MTDKLNAVFVYGTLRPSKVATHNIYDHEMYDYSRFPYLIKKDGAEAVKGNVIYVTDEQLEQLDHYEGVERGLYTRETVTAFRIGIDPNAVPFGEGSQEDCFVYIATDRLHPKRIPSGDWFQR